MRHVFDPNSLNPDHKWIENAELRLLKIERCKCNEEQLGACIAETRELFGGLLARQDSFLFPVLEKLREEIAAFEKK